MAEGKEGLMITSIENVKKPGWFSEPKNVATTIIGLSLFAGLGYLFAVYVLPFLITVTWNLINLIIGGAILGFLLMIITNKKFWRAIRYFSEFIANYTIGVAIELNPFNILQMKIEQGYKDRNTLYQQSAKLKGKQSELMDKLNGKEKELALNAQKVKILQQENRNVRQIDLYANNVLRCREYIDNVSPIVGDLNKLITFSETAYEESGIMLEDAKLDLEAKKDLYYSVTTSLSAVTSAMKAFKGDDDLNRDAEKALATVLKQQIGEKIGHIKTAIDVTQSVLWMIKYSTTKQNRRRQ